MIAIIILYFISNNFLNKYNELKYDYPYYIFNYIKSLFISAYIDIEKSIEDNIKNKYDTQINSTLRCNQIFQEDNSHIKYIITILLDNKSQNQIL